MAVTYNFVTVLDEKTDFINRASLLGATVVTNNCAIFAYRSTEQVKFDSLI